MNKYRATITDKEGKQSFVFFQDSTLMQAMALGVGMLLPGWEIKLEMLEYTGDKYEYVQYRKQ